MSTSMILRKSLNDVLNKKNEKKKDVAREINVSQQSLSDWTSQNNAKPVTIENALRLSNHFKDSTFTLEVIYQFFGMFKTCDGDVYRKDPSALDKLQTIESDERKSLKENIERIILKKPEYLSEQDISKIVAYASEYLDEVIVEITLLSSLCDLASIDIRYLSEQRLTHWEQLGYVRSKKS
ncbi:hypothetical protein EPB68_12710 [Enterococcus faecalis]|nr:hypothetical protein EPB68_12710 [Enterococcus faecalis]